MGRSNLWPGVGVHPAYTSQICSHCSKNAIAALKRREDEGVRKIDIKHGLIWVHDGALRLQLPADTVVLQRGEREVVLKGAAVGRYYRRRNERVPLTRTLSDGQMDLAEVKALLRRHLRRPSRSLRSKDTTQSWFVCAYDGCGHEMHADVNAAINIGRKFRDQILV